MSVIYFLNLSEDLRCSESWENCPLELHRCSIRSSSLCWREFKNQLIFSFHALTGFKMIRPIHNTERVGKDVGFCRRKLNCLVSKQGCPLPHKLLPIDLWDTWDFFQVPDQLLSYIEKLFQRSLGLIFGGMKILCIVFPKMNCSLKSNGHKHILHIIVFTSRSSIFVFSFATVSPSHIRENFLKMWNASSGNMKIVWPYCANTVDVWVSRRYEFPRTPVHLCIFFASLESSSLRLDKVLSPQVSLYSFNLVDRVLWVSADFLMQLDFAQSKTLSQHARPSSTSVLTLPQFSFLLCLLASFSPSFQGSW